MVFSKKIPMKEEIRKVSFAPSGNTFTINAPMAAIQVNESPDTQVHVTVLGDHDCQSAVEIVSGDTLNYNNSTPVDSKCAIEVRLPRSVFNLQIGQVKVSLAVLLPEAELSMSQYNTGDIVVSVQSIKYLYLAKTATALLGTYNGKVICFAELGSVIESTSRKRSASKCTVQITEPLATELDFSSKKSFLPILVIESDGLHSFKMKTNKSEKSTTNETITVDLTTEGMLKIDRFEHQMLDAVDIVVSDSDIFKAYVQLVQDDSILFDDSTLVIDSDFTLFDSSRAKITKCRKAPRLSRLVFSASLQWTLLPDETVEATRNAN